MESRTECVICKGKDLDLFYTLNHYPLCRHSSLGIETDRFDDLRFGTCRICGCVQLINLQDPELLYSKHNNQTYLTPRWKKHHLKLSEFILDGLTLDGKQVVEIGGTTGLLAREVVKNKPEFEYENKLLNYAAFTKSFKELFICKR